MLLVAIGFVGAGLIAWNASAQFGGGNAIQITPTQEALPHVIRLPFEITLTDPARRTIIKLPDGAQPVYVVIEPTLPWGLFAGLGRKAEQEQSHAEADDAGDHQHTPAADRQPDQRKVEVYCDKLDQPDADPDAIVKTNNSLLTTCRVLELAAPDAGAGDSKITGTVTVYFGAPFSGQAAVGGVPNFILPGGGLGGGGAR